MYDVIRPDEISKHVDLNKVETYGNVSL